MQILENVELKPYTAFKIGGPARHFCSVETEDELKRALAFAQEKTLPVLVISGGSNLLLSDNGFSGLVILLQNRGVSINQHGDKITINAAAGETWDKLVEFCVGKGWWGMENLSHIPGSVGAVAVQNVGAYGAEASQIIGCVKILDTQNLQIKTLSAADCGFGYRRSIFNSEFKNRYIIWEIEFILQTDEQPNLAYADVKKHFDTLGIENPTLPEIRQAIIKIRDRKFTLPDIIPNAGSFFKNLILNNGQFLKLKDALRQNFPNTDLKDKLVAIESHRTDERSVKFPTALLIDLCSLKGFSIGGAKINQTQPLVILNFTGLASSADVLQLMQHVRQAVYSQTGQIIEPEPELIGFSKKELAQAFNLK